MNLSRVPNITINKDYDESAVVDLLRNIFDPNSKEKTVNGTVFDICQMLCNCIMGINNKVVYVLKGNGNEGKQNDYRLLIKCLLDQLFNNMVTNLPYQILEEGFKLHSIQNTFNLKHYTNYLVNSTNYITYVDTWPIGSTPRHIKLSTKMIEDIVDSIDIWTYPIKYKPISRNQILIISIDDLYFDGNSSDINTYFDKPSQRSDIEYVYIDINRPLPEDINKQLIMEHITSLKGDICNHILNNFNSYQF